MATSSSTTTHGSSSYAASVSTPATETSAASPSLLDVNQALYSDMVKQMDLEQIRDDLIDIAYKAGQKMMDADPTIDESMTKKNTSDRVTATDRAVEAMVKEFLDLKHPDIQFLGEETFKEGQELSDMPTFVCDPIDGTLNFIHGFPNIAISLALTVGKQPQIGVVFNPFRGDLFSAIKGRGAYLTRGNGKTYQLPLKSNPQPINGLNDCLAAIEWGSERSGNNWNVRTHVSNTLLTSKADGGAMVHSIRSSGSAALDFCYVAAGWLDLFWEGGCWIWDVIAGWIIVEEAGGLVVGANPGEWEAAAEGRSYFCVRSAPSGQREVVEELWNIMGDRRFVFKK